MPTSNPLETFLAKMQASLADNSFVRLTLSQPVAVAGVGKIIGRLIELRGEPWLSLTLRERTRDLTKNLPLASVPAWVREKLDEFRSALLHTTARDWQLHCPAGGMPKLVSHKPACTAAPARTHDEPQHSLLNATACDWLHGLGVTDARGTVRAAMADKHRQINRYLEILSHLAADCGWLRNPLLSPEFTIADMGCGKGHLTFGAWHLFRRVHGLDVHVIGVEARSDLVEFANALARRIQADDLSFMAGDIESVALPRVDALVALHACNTATDDAIRRGIELGAKLIVVAPCCHQELRPQLGQPEPLAAVLRHGIMEERLAEWLTDGLRALFLEWAGYRTKVFEFVSSEHTPKNLMIAAIREREPFADEAARRRIVELKQFFGIQRYALDALLVGADVRRL
jgi:SAM-dependent methyltransferase